MYIDRLWLRTPAVAVAVADVDVGREQTMQAVIVRELLWSAIYLSPGHVLDCGRT